MGYKNVDLATKNPSAEVKQIYGISESATYAGGGGGGGSTAVFYPFQSGGNGGDAPLRDSSGNKGQDAPGWGVEEGHQDLLM